MPTRKPLALLILLVVAATGVLLPSGAAAAHDELLATKPADGSTVTAPPVQVELVFGAPALTLGTAVRVLGPSGAVVSVGPARLVANSVVESLRPDLPNGGYRVLWRVTSADGHPVAGEFRFTLAVPGGSPTASAGGATATGSAGTATAATTSPGTSPGTSHGSGVPGRSATPATTGAAGGGSGQGGGVPWGVVLGVLGAVLVVGVAGYLAARARRART